MSIINKSRLDILANVVLVLVAISVAAHVFWPTTTQAGITIGQHMPAIPGYKIQPKTTLVLVLRTGCPYCEASMPFYRRLSALHSQGSLKAHLVALFPGPGDEARSFLDKNGVDIPAVGGVDLEAMHVQGTPTLILVDRDGRIDDSWLGQLSSLKESNVISVVQSVDTHRDPWWKVW